MKLCARGERKGVSNEKEQSGMTYDELCFTVATKSLKTKEQWADFFALPPDLQLIEAKVIKDTVWEQSGPSVWDEIVKYVEIGVTVITDVAGVASGYEALKAV